MKTEYSRQFVKASYKLTGKYKESLKRIIAEVKQASDIGEVTDCIKMAGLQHSYRVKMGSYRLVFIHKIPDNIIIFELLLSRGEIYKKGQEITLRKKEKD